MNFLISTVPYSELTTDDIREFNTDPNTEILLDADLQEADIIMCTDTPKNTRKQTKQVGTGKPSLLFFVACMGVKR